MKLYTFSYKDTLTLCRLEEQIIKKYSKVSFVNDPADAEYIFAVGGDGTILAAKDLAIQHNLPIISINLGTLGFLASAETLEIVFDALLTQPADYVVKRKLVNLVTVPEVRGQAITTVGNALNEIVISHKERGKLMNLTVVINDEEIIFSCDSLIISTPVGSTAYNLSAGGSIIHPDLPVIILTPVAPFSMSARSIIIPEHWAINIVSKDDLFMVFDGHGAITVPAEPKRGIVVKDSVSLIRIDDMFFKSIQEKLKWNMPIKH